jgi:cellulose synthase/poly-beta-1,6-N-acetylglucosamine synthase-like glycosyltransferase
MKNKKKSPKPVNKTSKKKKKNKKSEQKNKNVKKTKKDAYKGVSIITVTNSMNYFDNIFDNFIRQNYEPKELIIVLNKNNLNISVFEERSKEYKNIKIYKVDENKSLGYCLNFGVKKAKFEIIAKFDHDDYYGPKYLSNSVKAFEYTDALLIGKRSHLVFFESNSLLALRNPGHENCYDSFVNGSTMIFKKEIFKKVKFPEISLAEDTAFCNSCIKKGIKIYSTDRYDHVYIRRKTKQNHAWKIDDKKFLEKSCKVIGKISDFKNYSDNH